MFAYEDPYVLRTSAQDYFNWAPVIRYETTDSSSRRIESRDYSAALPCLKSAEKIDALVKPCNPGKYDTSFLVRDHLLIEEESYEYTDSDKEGNKVAHTYIDRYEEDERYLLNWSVRSKEYKMPYLIVYAGIEPSITNANYMRRLDRGLGVTDGGLFYLFAWQDNLWRIQSHQACASVIHKVMQGCTATEAEIREKNRPPARSPFRHTR